MCVNGCHNPDCQYVRIKNKLRKASSRALKKHGAGSKSVTELELKRTHLKEQHAAKIISWGGGKKHPRDEESQSITSVAKRQGTASSESMTVSVAQERTKSVQDSKIHRRQFDQEGKVTHEEVEEKKSHIVTDKVTKSVEFKRCVDAYQERLLTNEVKMAGDRMVSEFVRANRHGKKKALESLPKAGMYANTNLSIFDALRKFLQTTEFAFANVQGSMFVSPGLLGAGKVRESVDYFEEKRDRFAALECPMISAGYGKAAELLRKVAEEVEESFEMVSKLDDRWQDKKKPAISQHEIGGSAPLMQNIWDRKLQKRVMVQAGVRRVYRTVKVYPLNRALIPDMLKQVPGLRKYDPEGMHACLANFKPNRITDLALRVRDDGLQHSELLRIIAEEWERGDFTSILSVFFSIQTEIRLLVGAEDMSAYANLELTNMRDFGEAVAFSPLWAYAPKKHAHSQLRSGPKTKFVECRVDFPQDEFYAKFGLDMRLPIQLMLLLLKTHVNDPETYHAAVREFNKNVDEQVARKMNVAFEKAQFDNPDEHFFMHEGVEVPLSLLDEPEFANYRAVKNEVDLAQYKKWSGAKSSDI
jgi:hypothetical protein